MQEPDTSTRGKSIVSAAYAVEAALHLNRRAETIRWYETVLDFMLDHADDPGQFDANLNGMIISDLINLQAVELLPQVRDLFNRELVNEDMGGTLEDVEKSLPVGTMPAWQLEIKSLPDQYAYLHDPDAYLAEHPQPTPDETDEAFAEMNAELQAAPSAALCNSEWAFLNDDEEDDYEPQQPRRVAPRAGAE